MTKYILTIGNAYQTVGNGKITLDCNVDHLNLAPCVNVETYVSEDAVLGKWKLRRKQLIDAYTQSGWKVYEDDEDTEFNLRFVRLCNGRVETRLFTASYAKIDC